MNTTDKLNQLAELNAQKDLLRLKKQELIDSVLTAEIKSQIAGIDAEFEPQLEAINSKDSELRKEIKSEILEHGETVKGAKFQAIWMKGRTKWNDAGLMNYLSVHPEIAYLRTTGKPSVSIRKVK